MIVNRFPGVTGGGTVFNCLAEDKNATVNRRRSAGIDMVNDIVYWWYGGKTWDYKNAEGFVDNSNILSVTSYYSISTCIINNELYAFRKYNKSSSYSQMFFKVASDAQSRTDLASPTAPMSVLTEIANIGSTIYQIPIYDNLTQTIQKYTVSTNTWSNTSITSPIYNRVSPLLGVGNNIYIVGYPSDSSTTRKLYKFNGSSWTSYSLPSGVATTGVDYPLFEHNGELVLFYLSSTDSCRHFFTFNGSSWTDRGAVVKTYPGELYYDLCVKNNAGKILTFGVSTDLDNADPYLLEFPFN